MQKFIHTKAHQWPRQWSYAPFFNERAKSCLRWEKRIMWLEVGPGTQIGLNDYGSGLTYQDMDSRKESRQQPESRPDFWITQGIRRHACWLRITWL